MYNYFILKMSKNEYTFVIYFVKLCAKIILNVSNSA